MSLPFPVLLLLEQEGEFRSNSRTPGLWLIDGSWWPWEKSRLTSSQALVSYNHAHRHGLKRSRVVRERLAERTAGGCHPSPRIRCQCVQLGLNFRVMLHSLNP